MEENKELMAELEGIITGAAKDLRQESANAALESLIGMYQQWRENPDIKGNAWFVGLSDSNPLFPDDEALVNGVHVPNRFADEPWANKMAVRCIATPESAHAFINMLEDPRFVMVSHQILRPDGLYGMFSSEEGSRVAISIDGSGLCVIVDKADGNRYAKAHAYNDFTEPDWDAMGDDQQVLEWIAAVMKAFMAPRMLMEKSPHMYKAFLTGIAAGEDDILDAFGITAEQLLEGLNDL
jgi:hypothetical protein